MIRVAQPGSPIRFANNACYKWREIMKKKTGPFLRCAMVFALMLSATVTVVHANDLAIFIGDKGAVKISGGTAHIPVMKAVAKMIMTANSDIHISIAGGGSGVGIRQVGEGLVNIGNSGRKPTDEEIGKYQLHMHQWAIDGVGVVVNPRNKVSALSTSQLKDVYSGKISNWQQLGGDDHAIHVYTRDKSSGTRAVFWKKALEKSDITTKAYFVASNGAMKSAIAGDPHAIGYVSIGHLDESVAPLALDNIAPTLENIITGQYPIARGLYSNTRGAATGLTKKFIAFLYSPECQKIISEKGFIPVTP